MLKVCWECARPFPATREGQHYCPECRPSAKPPPPGYVPAEWEITLGIVRIQRHWTEDTWRERQVAKGHAWTPPEVKPIDRPERELAAMTGGNGDGGDS